MRVQVYEAIVDEKNYSWQYVCVKKRVIQETRVSMLKVLDGACRDSASEVSNLGVTPSKPESGDGFHNILWVSI